MSPFKTVTHFIEKYQNACECCIANKQSNNKLKKYLIDIDVIFMFSHTNVQDIMKKEYH